jgi:hypothetical protein
MTDRHLAVEQKCLELTLATWTPEIAEGNYKRIYRIYLEGSYPETRLKAEGEYTYAPNDKWRVSLPIWQLTNHEHPHISEIERLMYLDILEA